MGLNIYKSTKQYVCKENEMPRAVKKFIDNNKDNFNNIYIDSVETLQEHFENNKKEFKIVKKWFEENDLFDFDLSIED